MNKRITVLGAAALTLTLFVTPGAVAHPDGSHDNLEYGIAFTCEGFVTFIPVDAQTAREMGDVPAERNPKGGKPCP